MVTGIYESFDLPVLLKKSPLNIRFIADNVVMPVKQYFDMLLRFLVLAPDVSGSLKRFINRKADMVDYKILNALTELLRELGADSLIVSFYSILGAYETGNWRLASTHAERIEAEFNELHTLIKAAKRNEKAKSARDEQREKLSLKEYIRMLDEEEANRKMVILAVDDSPVILKSVASVLSADYKVFTLPKPTELVKVLQKLTPDLFLLDYKMPEISGFDLVPIIRSFNEHKETPIIFLTSEGTMDNLTAAIALGASDFAVKPFNPDVLREKIAKHIVKKKLF